MITVDFLIPQTGLQNKIIEIIIIIIFLFVSVYLDNMANGVTCNDLAIIVVTNPGASLSSNGLVAYSYVGFNDYNGVMV